MEKEIEKQQQYASKVLGVIRDGLVVKYPFLARAVYELKHSFAGGFRYGTDGAAFLCDAGQILTLYLENVQKMEEVLLHSILHCLYLHPFLCKDRDSKLWNLSCDIYVYQMILLLDVEKVHYVRQREEILKFLEQKIPNLSAQSVYRYFVRHKDSIEILGMNVQELERLFSVDEHMLWYAEKEKAEESQKDSEAGGKSEQEMEGDNQDGEKDQIRRWSDIADHAEAGIAMNMENRIKEFGDRAGNLLESLQNIRGENKKYSEFLKQFAVLEERMLLDLDNFDYIYYTYGMQLFGDTPLIEPLEYKEMKTIHEFVIAIDTSGSCDRELVRKFLMKTYDILTDVTIFEGELKIYILQCDAWIQHEVVIHSVREMQEYTERVQIYGRGGTDFRPVFARVQQLREEKQLNNVRGLLYFTDGYGIYPKLPTDYKTAFVFAEMDGRVEVPSWAMKIYIEDETDL